MDRGTEQSAWIDVGASQFYQMLLCLVSSASFAFTKDQLDTLCKTKQARLCKWNRLTMSCSSSRESCKKRRERSLMGSAAYDTRSTGWSIRPVMSVHVTDEFLRRPQKNALTAMGQRPSTPLKKKPENQSAIFKRLAVCGCDLPRHPATDAAQPCEASRAAHVRIAPRSSQAVAKSPARPAH